jgi:hypothetical protein
MNRLSSTEVLLRIVAVEKLARIGTKDAYRKLYDLLDENTVSDPGPTNRDYITPPLSWYVMERLMGIVENPPTGPNRYSVEVWKSWFEKNKHLIE